MTTPETEYRVLDVDLEVSYFCILDPRMKECMYVAGYGDVCMCSSGVTRDLPDNKAGGPCLGDLMIQARISSTSCNIKLSLLSISLGRNREWEVDQYSRLL